MNVRILKSRKVFDLRITRHVEHGDNITLGTFTGNVTWEKDMGTVIDMTGAITFYTADIPDTGELHVDETADGRIWSLFV